MRMSKVLPAAVRLQSCARRSYSEVMRLINPRGMQALGDTGSRRSIESHRCCQLSLIRRPGRGQDRKHAVLKRSDPEFGASLHEQTDVNLMEPTHQEARTRRQRPIGRFRHLAEFRLFLSTLVPAWPYSFSASCANANCV